VAMTSTSSHTDRFVLTDHVAIITGAGKGIGAAIATTFAAAGADVVLTARTETDLETVAAEVRSLGRNALVVPGDVNDLAFLAELVEHTVGTFGRLDVVVNNAGGSISKPFLDTSVSQIEKSFHFNVSVPFELARLATPHLLKSDNASVINISSVAGQHALRGSFTHSLTKNSESHLTKLMAAELAPRIRVNAVLPGAIETDALATYLSMRGSEIRDIMHANTLMRRNGTPQDIADAVLFLVSPAACWITGKLLEVDGGAAENLVPKALPDLEP
jgi:7-alpha-hydroxysteroid dehydrogenase